MLLYKYIGPTKTFPDFKLFKVEAKQSVVISLQHSSYSDFINNYS